MRLVVLEEKLQGVAGLPHDSRASRERDLLSDLLTRPEVWPIKDPGNDVFCDRDY